jgi:hypothetical protein
VSWASWRQDGFGLGKFLAGRLPAPSTRLARTANPPIRQDASRDSKESLLVAGQRTANVLDMSRDVELV